MQQLSKEHTTKNSIGNNDAAQIL